MAFLELGPIYIRQETANILEMFDDLLFEHGIKIPSPEDDERGEDNEAALYGSVYSDLFDEIEFVLTRIAEEAEAGTEIVTNEWPPVPAYGILGQKWSVEPERSAE